MHWQPVSKAQMVWKVSDILDFYILFWFAFDQDFYCSPIYPVDCQIRFDCLVLAHKKPSIGIKLHEVTSKASHATLVIKDHSFPVPRRQKIHDPIEFRAGCFALLDRHLTLDLSPHSPSSRLISLS